MSHEATKWAWTTSAEHGARLVLLALAESHNAQTGLCCPSVARLCEMTRLGRGAVMNAIRALEAHNFIVPDRRNGCGSRYLLRVGERWGNETSPESEPVQNLDRSKNRTGPESEPVQNPNRTSPKNEPDRSKKWTRNQERTGKEPGNSPVEPSVRTVADTGSQTPMESRSEVERTEGHRETPQEPSRPLPGVITLAGDQNASATPSRSKADHSRSESNPRFDEFWNLYPRRVAKAAALKAWRRIKPTEVDSILADVLRRAGSDDWRRDGGRFVPHASTYLNGRRWEDESPAAPIPSTTPAAKEERDRALLKFVIG